MRGRQILSPRHSQPGPVVTAEPLPHGWCLTTVCRLFIMLCQLALMSPEVRKKLKGHHLLAGTLLTPWFSDPPSPQSPGPSPPQWHCVVCPMAGAGWVGVVERGVWLTKKERGPSGHPNPAASGAEETDSNKTVTRGEGGTADDPHLPPGLRGRWRSSAPQSMSGCETLRTRQA